MKKQIVKTLLAVELYEFTGHEIGLLKSKYLNKEYFDANILPKYCLDADGYIRDTYYWLNYVEEGEQIYHLFDAGTIDRLLAEEISQGGLEYMFEGINLTSMFSSLDVNNYEDFRRILPSAQYIVVEITYTYDGEGDSDMVVDVAGFMNKKLEFIKFEYEEDESDED